MYFSTLVNDKWPRPTGDEAGKVGNLVLYEYPLQGFGSWRKFQAVLQRIKSFQSNHGLLLLK